MARSPKQPDAPALSGALSLAGALAAGLRTQTGFVSDTVPAERPGGIHGANASFYVVDSEGHRWLVLVSRQS